MKNKIIIQPTRYFSSINFPIKIGDVVITESIFALCVGKDDYHYKMLYSKVSGFEAGIYDWNLGFQIDTCALVLSEDEQIFYCAKNSWVENFPKNTPNRFKKIREELFRKSRINNSSEEEELV